MDLSNRLGVFLRAFRRERDLTAMDIAARCQVPVSVILGVEHGDRPDDETMHTLSVGTGIPLVDLFRVMQGETVAFPPPQQLGGTSYGGESPEHDVEPTEPMTIIEAARDLGPAQIEKVMDYIALLKLAERGRRRTPSA